MVVINIQNRAGDEARNLYERLTEKGNITGESLPLSLIEEYMMLYGDQTHASIDPGEHHEIIISRGQMACAGHI